MKPALPHLVADNRDWMRIAAHVLTGFEAGEDVGRNSHPVAVISYQMWQGRFHGGPRALGTLRGASGRPPTRLGRPPGGHIATLYSHAFPTPELASRRA